MPKLLKTTSLLFFVQYFKKEVSDEVDFLHANSHESFPQIDTLILVEMIKHFQGSQNSKFAMPLKYRRKEVRRN